MSDQHGENIYARNKHGKIVYVLDVPNGRNNYSCMGCGREVVGCHRTNAAHKPYFRHHVTDIDKPSNCTYKDETYRHKLAKEILQRIKQIKVPGLKKNPPHGIEGDPMIISRSKIITAKKVLVERQFYEGEDNMLHYGNNPNIKVRENLLQPDITFLDFNNMPILFIEVVATNKIDQAKYLKIKRLGIDTVQVRIPRDSPEEIEKAFFTVKHTQWIYNHELESTEYIPTSGSHNKGISTTDEFQEGIFNESLACRTTQIGNLIRAINRCFESGHYSGTKESATRELSNAEETTARLKRRYDELREQAEKRAFKPFESDIKAVEDRRREIEKEENSLEERYHRKREEIEAKIGSTESKYQQRIETLGGTRGTFDERKADIKRERDDQEKIVQGIRDDHRREEEIIESAPVKAKKDIRSMGNNYREEIRRIDQAKDQLEKQEISAPEQFQQLESDLRIRAEEEARSFAESVGSRHASGDGPAYGKLRSILNNYGKYSDLEEIYASIKRVRAAKQWFETAPWTSWD